MWHLICDLDLLFCTMLRLKLVEIPKVHENSLGRFQTILFFYYAWDFTSASAESGFCPFPTYGGQLRCQFTSLTHVPSLLWTPPKQILVPSLPALSEKISFLFGTTNPTSDPVLPFRSSWVICLGRQVREQRYEVSVLKNFFGVKKNSEVENF